MVKIKVFLSFLFFLFTNSLDVLGASKICEIKFNQKGDEEAVERRVNIKSNSKHVNNKYAYDCYQIGVEHDKDKRPIANKPIYACCRKP